MSERKQILDMLAQGKINVAEAENLLKACEGVSAEGATSTSSGERAPAKFLHIQVDARGEEEQKVNIRVPVQLLKAGVKLASFMPRAAKDSVNEALHKKGINIDLASVKPNELDELLSQLRDTSIDVQSKNETVRIYCD